MRGFYSNTVYKNLGYCARCPNLNLRIRLLQVIITFMPTRLHSSRRSYWKNWLPLKGWLKLSESNGLMLQDLNSRMAESRFSITPISLRTPSLLCTRAGTSMCPTGRVSYRTYRDSLSPPVLHRKELMLPGDHPRRAEFQALTQAAEAIGLFRDPRRIGFRDQWLRLVHENGYQIVGHELIPIANDETTDTPSEFAIDQATVARHMTALVRHGFSAPVQALARYGLISPSVEVFDYGCGRGDDVRGLAVNGIRACGWDPHYAPNEPKREADVVNLGFVINVIEDFDERVEALHGAYGLTKSVLAVAAMLASQASQAGRPYRDGFITSRNTFQKYYTQAQLAAFIADVLGEEPIPVSPGVFFVFRDKDLEQRFLSNQQRSVTLLQRLERPEAVKVRFSRPDRIQAKYEANREALDALWHTWLRLGREPDKTEVEQLDILLQNFGSLSRALRFIAN